MTREELLARAQLLQKAKEIQKKKLTSDPTSAPAPNDLAADSVAALEGFGQGATLGYMPQLQALVEPAVSKVGDLVTGSDTYKDLPDYAQRRDAWAKHYEQTAEKNPKAYLGGQVGGGLTTALLPAGALAKGASLATKLKASAATGAAYRALSNPGETQGEVDPLQLQERSLAAADPIGLGIDLAIPGAGSGLKKIAETKAFKSLGPYARDAMKAMGTDKVKEIGREVLGSGALGWIPKSYKSLGEKLKALKESSGKNLGDTVESMAQKETGAPVGVSRQEVAQNLEQSLISPEIDAAGVLERNAQMKAQIDKFRRAGLPPEQLGPLDDNIPLLMAEMKKRNVAKEINFDRLPDADIPVNEQFNRQLLTQLKNEVEKGGETLAKKTGFDVDKFKKLKSEYGNLAAAESIASKRGAKESVTRFLSPSDYGTGLVGAGIGLTQGGSIEERLKNAALGGSLGIANKGARLYGNQLAARGANRMSQVLNSAAQNPLLTQGVLNPMQNNTWKTLYNKKDEKNGKK